MIFPTISNIKDIYDVYPEEDLIERGFVIINKAAYTTIDYVISKENTFETDLLKELRGIKFSNRTGNIIARPLHKFFNVGESNCPITIDNLYDVKCVEKLDGSMIHLTDIDGALALHTRKGKSDVAILALNYLHTGITEDLFNSYQRLFRNCSAMGETPIFEFTAPNNQIVIRYEKPKLTLLAIRKNISGEYYPLEALEALGKAYGIPYVRQMIPPKENKNNLHAYVDSFKDFEGIVVYLGNQVAKIKNSDYVLKHRAVDKLKFEKDVIQLCLDSLIDDVLPILPSDMRLKLLKYNTELIMKTTSYTLKITQEVATIIHKKDTRKEIALEINNVFTEDLAYFKNSAFKYVDYLSGENKNFDLTKEVTDVIKKHTSTSTKIEDVRETLLKGITAW